MKVVFFFGNKFPQDYKSSGAVRFTFFSSKREKEKLSKKKTNPAPSGLV